MIRLALASLLLLGLAGCAQKSELDAANERIKALEEKVASLEKAPGAKGAAPAANPEEEDAAGKLMQEVQEAVKNNDYATAKTKLADLTGKYAATKAGKAAGRMASEINLIGTDAAPIEAEKWFQGNGQYAPAGKATLLVFWEVWCPHCKKELPKLAEEEGKLKEKGVQVVAMTKVTKSATDEKVEEFIKESKARFPIGKEKDGSMSKAFAVSGIPAAALVKDGKVIWRGHPARLDDATLDKLLAG
jgi:thiol-disulfide isomerase/thioredoxin